MRKRHCGLQLWLFLVFILLLVAALLPGQILAGYIPASAQDSGHIILGAVVAALLSGVAAIRTGKYGFLRVLVFTAIFLVVVELLQIPLARTASLLDLLLGMSGAVSVLLFMASSTQRNLAWKRCCQALGVLLLVLALLPLLFTSTAYIARNLRFPVLADFSSAFGKLFLRSQGAELTQQQWSSEGEVFPARLCLYSGYWPGISVDHVVPDWRGYKKLSVVLFSDLAEPVKMELRVHDKQHNNKFDDRYNYAFSVHPGINRIEIMLEDIRRAPVSRDMDMHSIQGIMLFSPGLDRPVCIRLGTIKLLP